MIDSNVYMVTIVGMAHRSEQERLEELCTRAEGAPRACQGEGQVHRSFQGTRAREHSGALLFHRMATDIPFDSRLMM